MNIYDAAFRYLESRPRTVKQMRDRLKEKGFAEGESENVISELLDLGYLNDEEFVIAYLNNAFGKSKGLRLIRYELANLGVDRDTVEDAFARYADEYEYDFEAGEYERARKLAAGSGADDPRRTARKLSGKGFDYEIIGRVLADLRAEEY